MCCVCVVCFLCVIVCVVFICCVFVFVYVCVLFIILPPMYIRDVIKREILLINF